MKTITKFDGIDIYLFDQIQKGRLKDKSTILDAGCGKGRNMTFLAQNGIEVHGIDISEETVSICKKKFSDFNNIKVQVANLTQIPYPNDSFDFITCSAVLHFAKDFNDFHAQINELWRVLRTNGILFIRQASSIGIENLITDLGNNRYLLPDGSERFLVTLNDILEVTKKLNAELLDPIKTTNVQDLRCMTTWVAKKK
jgi:ubiquinone/menaquinone biosynthesis C-methylase UbiE